MAKPQIGRSETEAYLKRAGIDLKKEKVVLVGIRGYYLDTMGKKAMNDAGLWDDAFIWITETDMATFNGNVDPTRYFKNVASLKVGVWRYKPGPHGSRAYGPYPAYRQAAPVTVLRYVDGKAWKADTGNFGINIHHGSKTGSSTSSLGCQTIPYEQWSAFKSYGDMILKSHDKKDFAYLLADNVQGKIVTDPQPLPPKGGARINKAGLDLIKEFEGFYAKAYKDPVGIPTIGWGTIQYPDGRKVKMGDVCTKEEAEHWLLHEVAEKEKGVIESCKVQVSDNEFSALVSFAYNLGVGALKTSTLLKKLNEGYKLSAADEFLRWTKAGGKTLAGLVRRRKAERELFLS